MDTQNKQAQYTQKNKPFDPNEFIELNTGFFKIKEEIKNLFHHNTFNMMQFGKVAGNKLFLEKLISFYFNDLKSFIKEKLCVVFVQNLSCYQSVDENTLFESPINYDTLETLRKSYIYNSEYVYNVFLQHYRFVQLFQINFQWMKKLTKKFMCEFQDTVLQYSLLNFNKITLMYYKIEFLLYETYNKQNQNRMDDSDVEDLEMFDINNSGFNKDIVSVSQCADIFINMGWTPYLEEACNHILYTQIDKKIVLCKSIFDKPVLSKLTHWLEEVVLKWLQRILQEELVLDESMMKEQKENRYTMFINWTKKLQYYLMQSFGRLRFAEAFDIISEFPDSTPALSDIKNCLDKTHEYKELANTLIEQFSKRLLIPGVVTPIIIELYIQTIRVMRLIDPSTLLLEIVSDPVKVHLRERHDTLRCIVSSILADEESELYEQLGQQYTRIPLRNKKIHHKDLDKDYLSSDEDEKAAETWEPAPLNSDLLGIISSKSKKSDIISTLVNIFGSQDAFLTEYKNMLAERLLAGRNYSFDTELKNLELLKLRFGENSLHDCDIMLRDVKESERINTYIKENTPNIINSSSLPKNSLNVSILSSGYWELPESNVEGFQLPDNLQNCFDTYDKNYIQTKRMRKLNWYPHLGSVEITLTFENGSFDFNVTPLQAAIISLFDGKNNSLSAEYIASKINISSAQLRRKISFWIYKGVLVESVSRSKIIKGRMSISNEDIVYTAVKAVDIKNDLIGETSFMEGDNEEILNLEMGSKEYDMKLIEGFIMSILTTSGNKTIDKIYIMLKTVYMIDKSFQITIDNVRDILKDMAMKQKISLNGDNYSINA